MEGQLFKVMESAEGFSGPHTEWLTLSEADAFFCDLSDKFPEYDYWIQHHTDEEIEERDQKRKVYNDNAVDGWEDMFPHYED